MSDLPVNEELVTLTDPARETVVATLEKLSQESRTLRLAIQGRTAETFRYSFAVVEDDHVGPDDLVVDCGDFRVLIDKQSALSLKGTTIDFAGGNWKIDNPNPTWSDPQAMQIQQIIDEIINPGVASHGGNVELIAVQENIVYLQLGGGCQGCGLVDVTLRQGIERILKQEMPELVGVVDTTDHASGENPYYAPEKK